LQGRLNLFCGGKAYVLGSHVNAWSCEEDSADSDSERQVGPVVLPVIHRFC